MEEQIEFLDYKMNKIEEGKLTTIKINSTKIFYHLSFSDLQNLKLRIPYTQRVANQDRIDGFIDFLEKQYIEKMEIPDLNIIHVALLNNRFYIIDGQHRWTSLCNFFEKYEELKTEYYVSIYIYLAENERELLLLASRINNNYVSEPYLRLEEDDEDDRDIVAFAKDLKNKVTEKYGVYLSSSGTCRFPKFFLGQFSQYVIDKYPKWNVTRIMIAIDKLNEEKGKEYAQHNRPYYDKVHDICDNVEGGKPFYLAKEIRDYIKSITPSQKKEEEKSKRKNIDQAMRQRLWNDYFVDETKIGECVACKSELKMSQYHASHIQSVKEGGDNILANLTILCSKCNTSMGSMNLNTYLRKKGMTPSLKYQELHKWSNEDLQKSIDEMAEKPKKTRKKKEVKENEE